MPLISASKIRILMFRLNLLLVSILLRLLNAAVANWFRLAMLFSVRRIDPRYFYFSHSIFSLFIMYSSVFARFMWRSRCRSLDGIVDLMVSIARLQFLSTQHISAAYSRLIRTSESLYNAWLSSFKANGSPGPGVVEE